MLHRQQIYFDKNSGNGAFSYASNFENNFAGEVNDQTGRYSFSINALSSTTNHQLGPEIELILSLSDNDRENYGLGPGFSLNLTEIDISNQILYLSSGEALKLNRNLDSVIDPHPENLKISYVQEGNRFLFTIEYKDGLKEVLTSNARLSNFATVTRREDVFGRGVNFKWQGTSVRDEKTKETLHLLEYIVDDYGLEILNVEPLDSQKSKLHFLERYTIDIIEKNIYEMWVSLPYGENQEYKSASAWHKLYSGKQGIIPYAISQVDYPSGRKDQLFYNMYAIKLPAPVGGQQFMPGVEKIIITGTDRTPSREVKEITLQVKEYNYNPEGNTNNHNYLGYGSSVQDYDPWSDNSYKITGNYQYLTEIIEYINVVGEPDKTTKTVNTYDKFHNQVMTMLVVGDCIIETKRDFLENESDYDKPLEQQILTLKQPKRLTTTYKKSGLSRAETVEMDYDEAGNLVEMRDFVENRKSNYTYYDTRNGALPDCPEYSFIHYLKTKNEQELVGSSPDTVRTEIHTHKLNGSGIVQNTIEYVQANIVEEFHYYNDELAGTVKTQSKSFNGYIESTNISYELDVSLGEYVETKTISAPQCQDNVVEITHYDLITGNETFNDNQGTLVTSHYYNDGRLHKEIIDEGGANEAFKEYFYNDIEHTVSTTDKNGTITTEYLDGLGREYAKVITVNENGSEILKDYLVVTTKYDLGGRTVEIIEYDIILTGDPCWNLENEVFPTSWEMRTTFEHDDWGYLFKTQSNGGPVNIIINDPIEQSITEKVEGLPYSKIIHSNYGREERTLSMRSDGQTYGTDFVVKTDGLGRTLLIQDRHGGNTHYTYDQQDRTKSVIKGDKIIDYIYSEFSPEIRLSEIICCGISVGHREFDGFGRLIVETYGDSQTIFNYSPGQLNPNKQILPNNTPVSLGYNPTIEDYTTIGNLTMTYDPVSAEMTSATEDNKSILSEYRFDGLTKKESSDDNWFVENYYSLAGKITARSDKFGNITYFLYDDRGRLERELVLDDQVTAYTYDEYDRIQEVSVSGLFEAHREVDMSLLPDKLTSIYSVNSHILREEYTFSLDGLLEEKQISLNEASPTIHTYQYDEHQRLKNYFVEGPLSPADKFGNIIASQIYNYDPIDNIRLIEIEFKDGSNIHLNYNYENTDPNQLSSITAIGSNSAYPLQIIFEYDQLGNMLNDENGLTYGYDNHGRLELVSTANNEVIANYYYDAIGRLSKTIYQDGQKSTYNYCGSAVMYEGTVEEINKSYYYIGNQVAAITQKNDLSGASQETYLSDIMGSPIQVEVSGGIFNGIHEMTYTPYGLQKEVATSGWKDFQKK
ncbi:RHS repeat domain-containing protein [Zooshikella sp. RANM57]|uniref:RHS repeat domain-containing protein n=1 Tax=Zooshikella sp. RANM57 TaxID=3425863 RepID=UPI003D6E95A1